MKVYISTLACLALIQASTPYAQATEPDLRGLILSSNTTTEVYSDLKNQLKCAQEEIMNLQETNYNLKNELYTTEDQLKEIQHEKKALEELIKETEESIKGTEQGSLSSFGETSKLIKDKEKTLTSLNNSLKIKNKMLREKDLQLLFLQDEIESYKLQLSKINKKFVLIKNTIKTPDSELQDKLGSLEDKLQKLEEAEEQLLLKNAVLKEKIEKLNAEREKEKALSKGNIAIEELEEQFASDRNHCAIFYYNLANLYNNKKDNTKAISYYQKTLKLNPKLQKVYCNMGIAYAENGDYDNSVKYLSIYAQNTNNKKEKESINKFISQIHEKL